MSVDANFKTSPHKMVKNRKESLLKIQTGTYNFFKYLRGTLLYFYEDRKG